MKNLITALLAVVPSVALASAWELDSAHSSAKFTVRHMMVSDVTGTLGKVSGTLNLDDKDVTKSKVDVTIAVDPQTQEQKRDDHLKSPDFFDVAKFPKATFKSKKVEKAGDKLKVTGDLTLKDATKEVIFDVALAPEVVNPFNKKPARGVSASATINRGDFGLTWNMPMANSGVVVGNDVKIDFSAELAPPAAAAPAAPAKK